MGALIDFTAKRVAKLALVAPVAVETPAVETAEAVVADAVAKGWKSGIETIYVGAADTAKLVRPVLKQQFPGIKFSVKSSEYSMGSSVTMAWADGPTEKQVRAALDKYDSSYMEIESDYHGSTVRRGDDGKHYNYLPLLMYSRGTSPAAALAIATQVLANHGITDHTPTLDSYGCVVWGQHWQLQDEWWPLLSGTAWSPDGTCLGLATEFAAPADNVIRHY